MTTDAAQRPRIRIIGEGWDVYGYLVRDVDTVVDAIVAVRERYGSRIESPIDERRLPEPGFLAATTGFYRWEMRGDCVEEEGERGRLCIAPAEPGTPGAFPAIYLRNQDWLDP